MKNKFMVIILAAGKGTRLNSDLPKVLHTVAGKPMVHHVIETTKQLGVQEICLVVGYKRDMVMDSCSVYEPRCVVQEEQLGTGHAIICTMDEIRKADCDHVLILSGDCPLIQLNTLESLMSCHLQTDASATILTALLEDAGKYGRIIRNNEELVMGIKEAKDCSSSELAIKEFNSGIYCFNAQDLLSSISELTTDNAQNEYYLTDTIELLKNQGSIVSAFSTNNVIEVTGVNTKEELELLNKQAL